MMKNILTIFAKLLSALLLLPGCETEEVVNVSDTEAKKINELFVLKKNDLYALDAISGELLWHHDLQKLQDVQVTGMSEEILCVGAYVFDRKTGELLARSEKENSRYVGGTADNLLKVVKENERGYVLYCFDRNEEIKWQHSGGAFLENISIDKETVFLSDEEGFAALDLDSGKIVWRFPVDGLRLKTKIDNQHIAIGILEPHPKQWENRPVGFEPFLVLVDRDTGNKVWKLDYRAVPVGMDGDHIYLAFPEEISAYSIAAQEKIWEHQFHEIVGGSIWAASDTQFIYANVSMDNGDYLFCLDTESGNKVWKKEGIYFLTPVPGDELVYLSTWQQLPPHVIALKKNSGEEVWRFEIEAEETLRAKLEPIYIFR